MRRHSICPLLCGSFSQRCHRDCLSNAVLKFVHVLSDESSEG
jgi:hypothetical protein